MAHKRIHKRLHNAQFGKETQMICSFKNCLSEVSTSKDVVQTMWKVESTVFDPRANCVQFIAMKNDHPLGLAEVVKLTKKGAALGSLYFQWLSEADFQKVKMHLVREYDTQDNELQDSVDTWLRRKMDELWVVTGAEV